MGAGCESRGRLGWVGYEAVEVVVKKVAIVGLALAGLLGCAEEKSIRGPTADEVPQSVPLAGGDVTIGFAQGTLRLASHAEPGRITKYPITVEQYGQCVAVGACTVPNGKAPGCTTDFRVGSSSVNGRTLGMDNKLPITCTTPAEASAYCKWVGGRLPTLAEWMLAARGSSPQRFAWGNSKTKTCVEHVGLSSTDSAGRRTPCSTTEDGYRVGLHAAARAPSGIEDVLLTAGELVAKSDDSKLGACQGAECIVTGQFPASIDAVSPVRSDGGADATYGFRCRVEGGAR